MTKPYPESTAEQLRQLEAQYAQVQAVPEVREAVRAATAAMEAANLVAQMRRAAGFSQTELAKKLGVSQARVAEIERGSGRDGPSYRLMADIAAACGLAWPKTVAQLQAAAVGTKIEAAPKQVDLVTPGLKRPSYLPYSRQRPEPEKVVIRKSDGSIWQRIDKASAVKADDNYLVVSQSPSARRKG